MEDNTVKKRKRIINNVFKQLRKVISDCYDFDNHCMLDNDKLPVAYDRLIKDANRKIFIERLISYLLDSKYMHGITKLYLISSQLSLEGLVKEYNKRAIEHISENSVSMIVWRDREKFSNNIGKNVVVDIIYSSECDLDFYKDNLYRLEIVRDLNCICNQFVRSLPLDENNRKKIRNLNIRKDITDDEYYAFLKLVYPYTKNGKESFNDSLLGKQSLVGYTIYLLSNGDLSEADIKRKEALMGLID